MPLNKSEVESFASQYQYLDETPCLRIGETAAGRGFYTLKEIETISRWKTPTGRTLHLVLRNTEEDVEYLSSFAIQATDERERIDALCGLHGVGTPTASALLYFLFPADYPIIDRMALASLGVEVVNPGLGLWLDYLVFCRSKAEELGLPIRTLDKALWHWRGV